MPDPVLTPARGRPSGRADSASAQAPYARVKEFLKQGLASGRWPPGALMPSEAELVAQFSVSRMTVTRALRELQNEGLVTRVQGLGTYAAHLLKVSSTLTIRDLHEEITARGHRHHAEVHLAREESASATVATQLGLARGAPVFHTLIVHFENGLALQCEDRYVNPACAPDYLRADFSQITPTHYLLQVAPLWEAQYAVEAGSPSAREARLLGIPAPSPRADERSAGHRSRPGRCPALAQCRRADARVAGLARRRSLEGAREPRGHRP